MADDARFATVRERFEPAPAKDPTVNDTLPALAGTIAGTPGGKPQALKLEANAAVRSGGSAIGALGTSQDAPNQHCISRDVHQP